MNGKPASGQLVAAALCAVLMASGFLLVAGQPAQAQAVSDPGRFVASHRLAVDVGDLTVNLFRRPAGPEVAAGQAYDLRLAFQWRDNGTAYVSNRTVQVFLFHCAPFDDDACRSGLRERTEHGLRVQDAADGARDGSYRFRTDPNTTFDREGSWGLEAHFVDEPQARVTFRLEVVAGSGFLHELGRFAAGWLEDLGFTPDVWQLFLEFAVFLGLFVVLAWATRRVLLKTAMSPHRVDPAVAHLFSKFIFILIIIFGTAFALWSAFNVSLFALTATIGLLSVALGFGMQNTVANLMGGINLAVDKPFLVGDRVKVGEYWGDVESIGLRSTRIVTPRKEYVIIPNKIMDEKEIWNYTISHPELRVDIDFSISYESDWRMAERISMNVANQHALIMKYPRPRVLMRAFGDHGVTMQLRCWLANAIRLRQVESDLRKALKDAFDEWGVEIPYPRQMTLHPADVAKPRRFTPEDYETFEKPRQEGPKLLVATAGAHPARRKANLVARIARELELNIVALYIADELNDQAKREGLRALGLFQEAGNKEGVWVKPVMRSGEITETIVRTAQEEAVDLLVLGAGRSRIISQWKRPDFGQTIREKVNVPVMIIPRSLELSEKTIDHYRKLLEKRVFAKGEHEQRITGDEKRQDEQMKGE